MDQFNKVLAAFLILVVAVGISLFVFSRLGVLGRILPTSKLAETQKPEQLITTPTPTLRQAAPTPTPEKRQGILGWLSQLGKPKVAPTDTPPTPTPHPATKQEITPSTEQMKPPEQGEGVSALPNVTIVPYGSVSTTTYPASGAETAFAPLAAFSIAIGVFLKNKTKS